MEENNYKETIDEISCKICYQKQSDIIFFNCFHIVCCTNCFKQLKNLLCPICKSKILTTKIIKSDLDKLNLSFHNL